MNVKKVLIARWDHPGHFRNLPTISRYLISKGIDVSIATVTTCKKEDTGLSPSVEWCTYGFQPYRRPSWLERLKIVLWFARIIKGIPHDLLYVFDSWTVPYAIIGKYLAGNRKTPWIYHTIDWLEPGRYPLRSMIEKWACRYAAVAINTDRTRARLQQTLYKLPEMPTWVPNYLSINEKIPERDETLRKSIMPSDASQNSILLVHPTIASPARLVVELIKALSMVDKRVVLFQIAVDNEYKRICQDIAEKCGVAGRIVFHQPVSYWKLMQILKCADISAIFHDHRSSSGYFLCNADRLSLLCTCGVPFVASNYPNMEAIVYRYGLGECCDPYSPESIASALNKLLHGDTSLEERKKRVRISFEESLNFEKYGYLLLDTFERALNK